MKRIISIYSIIISALIAIGSFVSCSNDIEQFDNDGFEIGAEERNTLATRSANPSGDDFGSQEGWSTEIIGEMNCCSVYAITARYRELAGSSCRYGHESLSVGSVYSDIKKYATDTLHVNFGIGGVSQGQFEVMCNYTAAKYDKNIYNSYVAITSPKQLEDFLTDKTNRRNVVFVCLYLNKTNECHVAYVSNVNSDRIKFDGWNGTDYGGSEYYYKVADSTKNIHHNLFGLYLK